MKVIKIKLLLPSLREKKRYLLYEIDGAKNKTVFLYEKLKDFLGELGMAKIGVKFLIEKGNKGIMKINHKFVDEVRMAFALIKEARVRILKVSGVINKLKEVL